jgi:ribonuclease D
MAWPAVALDCESNGMHAYRARLCAMQLCPAHTVAAHRVYIVDPLALDPLDALVPLLGPDGPPKILHDLGFDTRLLLSRGLRLGNVRDTAVHARFLGMTETGLGSLLSKHLGCTLAKAWQHHDWALRPWPAEALRYLADDVAYLGPLHAFLAARAAETDIAAEVDEESRYALQRALDASVDARPAFARVKGYRQLTGAARVAIRALAALRETVAEALDLPPGRVVANAALLELARVRPRTVASLRAIAHSSDAPEALDHRWTDALAEALRRRELAPEERAWFDIERPPADLVGRRAREAALARWRSEEALRRGVDLQVVLPGHCLSELSAAAPRSLDELARAVGLGAVRVARYGPVLLEIMGAAT